MNEARPVAIIPARGGSKRIPRKNVNSFFGRPMLAWPLAAALRSGLFARVIVSTEDEEIARVAREAGAETPFTRPVELADDDSGTGAVMEHAAQWLQCRGELPRELCCIYPTGPFVAAEDLRRGLEVLRAGDWSYVIAATTFDAPVYRGFHFRAEGGLQMLFPQHAGTRSQDLPKVFHDAAQFYWGRAEAWLHQREGLGADSTAVLIPRWRVQDIDDEEDWRRAELMAPALLQEHAR
jgi:N-acylneuraminate cytidylyltransferase